jgi:hypothetical protein
MGQYAEVVIELRALHVLIGGNFIPEVERICEICERGAMEIERLRAGLIEIAAMGEEPFNRQSVRAREILINDSSS